MHTLQVLLNYVQLANNRRAQVGILRNSTLLKISCCVETNSSWYKEKPTTNRTFVLGTDEAPL